MALIAKAATCNGHLANFEAAFYDLMNELDKATTADRLFLKFPEPQRGLASATVVFQSYPRVLINHVVAHGAEGDANQRWFIPGIDIGGIPLTFRICNEADEVS
jgi:hypothetical protein